MVRNKNPTHDPARYASRLPNEQEGADGTQTTTQQKTKAKNAAKERPRAAANNKTKNQTADLDHDLNDHTAHTDLPVMPTQCPPQLGVPVPAVRGFVRGRSRREYVINRLIMNGAKNENIVTRRMG